MNPLKLTVQSHKNHVDFRVRDGLVGTATPDKTRDSLGEVELGEQRDSDFSYKKQKQMYQTHMMLMSHHSHQRQQRGFNNGAPNQTTKSGAGGFAFKDPKKSHVIVSVIEKA